jgi:small conductance mechanosensitive channel
MRLACHISSQWILLLLINCLLPPLPTFGQTNKSDAQAQETGAGTRKAPAAPEKVDVQPVAADTQISKRLVSIYDATGWFQHMEISVRDGVVFLRGATEQEKYHDWAESLAQKTEGVVAVVNQINVTVPETWDFSPAGDAIREMGRNVARSLPVVIVALCVLLCSVVAARIIRNAMRKVLRKRVSNHLLREVAARTCGVLLFLLGLYFVLRISGLSSLAATVIGGTGLIGLVLGIAFRDISENFLASMFLSMQNPFREGDLVDVGGTIGFVVRLTSRATVLTNLEGIQVQIPNAMVFKSTIRNLTSNPNRQETFMFRINFDAPIQKAQETALAVLAGHPMVLPNPEPLVLVDDLGPATVNVKVYYWFDGGKHSQGKLRSSVIRLVKTALNEAGISLTDTAREIVFPRGVQIRMDERPPDTSPGPTRANTDILRNDHDIASACEKDLHSEAGEIRRQGQKGWSPEKGENLLGKSQKSEST